MAWKTVAVVYAGIFEIGKADPTDAVGAGLSLENILLLAPDDVFASLFRDTGAVYDAISIYGTLLVVVYFLLEIAETNLNGGFTYETFAKLCVQTIFMFLFIRNGMDFIEYGASVCGDILMTLQRTPDGSTPPFSPSECPYHDAIASGWIPGLTQAGMVLKYGIPYMVALISYCILQIIIWGRVLDIAIRIMFAPIGMSDLLKDGLQSNGAKYFKKLFASFLQGACMFGVVMSYNVISTTMSGTLDIGPDWSAQLLVGLATLTAIKQTGSLAKEIIGT